VASRSNRIATCSLAALAGVWVAGALAATGLTLSAAGPAEGPAPPWRVVGFPGQTKPFTKFSSVSLEGQRVLRLDAQLSYGFLVHSLEGEVSARILSWRWRVDEPNPQSDLSRKDGDDSPVKVCAMFDLPITAVPFIERQVLRLARLRAGEHIPAANICYVWDAHREAGSALDNAYTRRIRYIVLRGPEAPLRAWVSDQRDIRADFLRLFGEEAQGKVPSLVGIALGADADNTRRHSVAHVGEIVLN
jgi:hypothetical protein